MTTSEKVDLVINGGIIVSPDAEYRASIAIKDGKIHAIGAPEAMPTANETLDASGMHVLPARDEFACFIMNVAFPTARGSA